MCVYTMYVYGVCDGVCVYDKCVLERALLRCSSKLEGIVIFLWLDAL